MIDINTNNISIENIDLPELQKREIALSVIRLDLLHPIISGNKWFKLRYYLEKVPENATIATFGGAFSNHMLATAAACNINSLKSVCIIRGEEPQNYSASLLDAKALGMRFIFIGRKVFKEKEKIKQQYNKENWFWINEGGYGLDGAKGAATIHEYITYSPTHVLCAVGTGTTFAGLIKSAEPHQTIIGIHVLKGNTSIDSEIGALLNEGERQKKFELLHNFHFGGYAKHPKALIDFMNDFWERTNIPTDIVYTSKLFYAVEHLINNNFFPNGSKIVVVHSGGLQGNRSLKRGSLRF